MAWKRPKKLSLGHGRLKTAALIVGFLASLAALILAAWLVSIPCRLGDPGIMIGGAMQMGGCYGVAGR